MEVLSPEVLVQWCQRTLPDDAQAFEQLVAEYKQRVFGMAYRIMRHPQEAEDQAQEVFLKVYHGIKNLSEAEHITVTSVCSTGPQMGHHSALTIIAYL